MAFISVVDDLIQLTGPVGMFIKSAGSGLSNTHLSLAVTGYQQVITMNYFRYQAPTLHKIFNLQMIEEHSIHAGGIINLEYKFFWTVNSGFALS